MTVLTKVGGFGLVIASVLPACKESTSPSELTQVIESEHYIYHFSSGDGVDTVWQETYHRWLLSALQVTLPQKLEYYKYRDRDQMKRLTGKVTNGWQEEGTYRFHTIWPEDNHECVHAVVNNLLGMPPALFSEGIAVAHSTLPANGVFEPQWNGTSVHDVARSYLRSGQMPPLDRLIETRGFRSYEDNLTYPIAGSFVRYLIDTSGLGPVKEFFRTSGRGDGADRIRAAFQAAFGETIDAAWTRWQESLQSGP